MSPDGFPPRATLEIPCKGASALADVVGEAGVAIARELRRARTERLAQVFADLDAASTGATGPEDHVEDIRVAIHQGFPPDMSRLALALGKRRVVLDRECEYLALLAAEALRRDMEQAG